MKKIVAFAILAALLSACSQTETREVNTGKDIRVKTVQVKLVGSDQALSYSGTVEASQVIPLSFRTIGTVMKVNVDVGDEVRKGQVLATLDNAELQNIHDAAQASYRQAEDAYSRLKQVYDQGSLPEIKWVEMQTNLDQARSSLELAKNNLDKCNLLAPVSGVVGRRNIEPGMSSVSLASAPIELVKMEEVLVKIAVPENEINKFSVGQKGEISVSALGDKQYEGAVTHISPVAELMSRTYTVKVAVNNPGQELKPGMVCDVKVALPQNSASALVVPVKAVSRDSEGNPFVFVVSSDNKTVRKQTISVGRYRAHGIEVTAGLSEGQTIVSEGIEKLSDNSSISL